MSEFFSELSSNEYFLNLVLNTTQNLIFVKDVNGRFVFVNKAVADLFGLEPHELIQKHNSEVHHNTPEVNSYNKIDLEVISKMKSVEITESFTNKNGEVRWFHTIKQPMIMKNGEVVVLAVSTDVTERKNNIAKLESSKKLIEGILDNLPINIFAKNQDGRFVFFNKKCAETIGIKKEEALGRSDFDIFDENTAKRLVAKDKEALRRKKPTFTEEYIDVKGEQLCLYAGKVPIEISESEKILLGFSIDITDRKLAEEKLRIINESLTEAIEEQIVENIQKDAIMIHQSRLATMGEMIGAIAHQWRQPLNAIGILIQELRMACSIGVYDQAYVGEIIEDSMRQIKFMSDTIDDFRNFFLPDKKKNLFDVGEAVVKALNFLSVSFRNSDIRIDILKKDKAMIYGFENEFLQAILNILANAKDAIIENKVKNPYVAISISSEGSDAILTIEDNGGGIPKNILDRVFEPYFTTKEFNKGTGIGLYMTKMIIEEHLNGEIFIDSYAENTIVTIKLKKND